MKIAIIIIILFSLWILWGWFSIRSIEQPKFNVIKSEENYEVREYEEQIIAKTSVKGERKEATNEGFRLIANYIFGNNTVNESIAMTSPVISQDSEAIAMTSPVTSTEETEGTYTISFIMPSKYTIENIPKPINKDVVLEELAKKTYAVLSFSGYTPEKKVNEKIKDLEEALENDELSISKQAILSQYNPPWTPWFMRRNEIWIELN
jgi:hypothetical protein